ncbi:restriction endonuclease subunit S [Flavobacteriales bacterium]|nr:restriction endonuclease subunit S [Flavobacteriales bacterium]
MRWEVKRMADIADVTSGQSPPGSSYNQDGIGMEFHQGKKHFGDSSLNGSGVWTTEVTRKALPGDIVMSVRAPVGPINYVEREVCIGRGLASIRPKEAIKRGFLAKFLLMNEGRINGHAGATFNSINKKEIEGILVPLPPLDEQERIVEVLDEAFAAIDKAKVNIERNLTNTRELFQSRLNDIFSNPSEDWEVKPLGEVLDVIRNGLSKKQNKKRIGRRVSRIETIATGEINEEKVGWVDCDEVDAQKFSLFKGDILFSHINSKPHVGKTALVEEETDLIHGMNLLVFRQSKMNSKLLNWYFVKLRSDGFWIKTSKQSVNQASVNQKDICAVEVPIPPLDEQELIVGELGALDEMKRGLESKYQTELDNLEELRQSILEQAFEGKLTEPVVV